jgi:hypothetical protein
MLFDPWIRIRVPRSGINIPDHISKSLVTVFILGLKILKFFVADPGSGAFLTLEPESVMEKSGSGILLTDIPNGDHGIEKTFIN